MSTSGLNNIHAAHARLRAWYNEEYEINRLSPLPLGSPNWTYGTGDRRDEHVLALEPCDVIFMGFNPGSGDHAEVPRMSRSERSWRTRCSRLARTEPHRIVFAELICLPTHTQAVLGDLDNLMRLMKACLEVNQAIIAFHKPKIVFQSGISAHHLSIITNLYDLTLRDTLPRKTGNGVLLHEFSMPDATPWIAFRHFASPGFSNADREQIQNYAERCGWPGESRAVA